MSYRYEKTANGNDIVIDGFEKGIADSPYLGISNLFGVNNKYLPGAIYGNYARIQISPSPQNSVFTANTVANTITTSLNPFYYSDTFTVSTTGSLPAPLMANTTYYNITAGNNLTVQISASRQGSAIDITTTGTGVHTITLITPAIPKYSAVDVINNIVYIVDSVGNVWDTSNLSGPLPSQKYFTLIAHTPTEAYGSGLAYREGFLFLFENTIIEVYNVNTMTWTNSWQTGLTPSVEHMAFVATDDVVYFCNGNSIGSIITNDGFVFDPTDVATYTFTPTALLLPVFEVASWISQLQINLLVSGKYNIYPWDRTSTSFTIPLFINEIIHKIINIMNIIYIVAGNKGNLYESNGYSISLFKKIPDHLVGRIDPQWTWGGISPHRGKIYLGAVANDVLNQTTGIGTYSIDVGGVNSYSVYGTSTGSLTVENGTSQGPTINSSNDNITIVVDDNSFSYDTYFTAWYQNGVGGMDYNYTTMPSGYTTVMESDLIPVGTFLTSQSFNNLEFKFDEPMLLGDSIRVSARQSLTDSYVVLGTTTTQILSDVYNPLPIQKFQWLQIKVEYKFGSPTSFNRLREIRIRQTQ